MANDLQTKLDAILNDKNTNLKPENLKKGITCLGVVGTLEAGSSTVGVKLFETEAAMQADTTAKEGDLAVIYRSDVKSVSNGDIITSITFPKTVVFDEAITSGYNSRLRNSNEPRIYLDMELNASMFMVYDMYRTIPEIEYSSTDGITYTRTDSNEDTYEIGETTVKDLEEPICKFMQVGGHTFGGLFESRIDTNIIQFLNLSAISFTNIDTTNKDATATLNNNDKHSLKIDKSKLLSILKANNISTGGCTLFVTSNNELMYTGVLGPLYDTTGNLLGYRLNGYSSNASSKFYKINLDDSTVTQVYTKAASNHYYDSSSSDNYYYLSKDEIDCVTLPTYIESNTNTYSYSVSIASIDSNNPLEIYVLNLNYDYQGTVIKYFSAPTQLTTLPDEVWSSTFYGKNGAEIGTLQETTNLDKNQLKNRVMIWNKYNTGLSSNSKNLSSCFSDCTDLITIPLIDTSETVDMSQMFYNCTNLTTIPQLNTSKVTNTTNMFYGCSKLETIPLIDTSIVTAMSNMFRNCSSLKTIPLLDMSSTTTVGAMFMGCSKLETIPQLNISNATTMDSMFRECTSLTTVPTLNTSKITGMQNVFNGCTSLVTVAPLDASSTTRLDGMFQDCSSLTTISLSNTSKVTMIDSMFKNCTSLITAPTLSMVNVTRTVDAFNGCTNLTTMPIWNMPNVEFVYNMFAGCTNLSDESLNNILAMCINATKVNSSYKTLKNMGLTSDQATKCKTLSNYSAFTSAGWTTGY